MKKAKQTLTLRQIAKLAKTSKSTVSRVLTNHPSVSPKTRERIQSVIRKHGFKPNLFARGLAGGRTGLIAVIASEMNSGFFAEVLKGIDVLADEHEGHVLSSFAHGVDDFLELWKSIAGGGRVDGVILIAPPLEIMDKEIEPHEVPVVLCACRPTKNPPGWSDVDSVAVNNRHGLDEIMRHLVEQGCRRFCHIAGPDNIYDAVERREAFESFIADHPNMHGDVVVTAMARETGRKAALEYLRDHAEKPDAFVCVNDLVALGTLEALKERGIEVPAEVAVTGCDDDSTASILGLTTLHMPMVELGREAGRLLFERLETRGESGPARESTIDMTLRVRSTSLAAKGN